MSDRGPSRRLDRADAVESVTHRAMAGRFGAVVLAAGAGSRFGGHKLLALLEGRPLLQHVLDALAQSSLAATIVVLGTDRSVVERTLRWRGERRVSNPDPARGLASSLQVGLAAATTVEPALDGVFVVLGDQPRIRPGVLAALAGAAAAAGPRTSEAARSEAPGCLVVLPRYSRGGGPNPVLLLRQGWALVATLSGDRGLGPVLAAHPELVHEVAVEGSNPDVDTPHDLLVL